ncbi:hypothetical protein Tco_0907052 [Tanacetum coccineum]|uniref:Uncharacterized protein n=1 Tax=Tanacetum coccineum TaxID=301880 RepID=A0ABQ5CL29_9ASTR
MVVSDAESLQDVAGYVTNVGRTTYTKSGSKTLDVYLANQRVTLLGGLGDVLVERKTNHVGMCAVVLTIMSAKDYNNKLYLSSSSSTVIYDDDDIPCLHELKNDNRQQPSTIRLEVVVVDDTAHTVVVMFNDTATELVKCLAKSLMAADDEGVDADDDSNFPTAIRNLFGIHPLPLPDTTRINVTQIAGPSSSKYASTRLPRRSAVVYVLEFQKRSLPHTHILLWLKEHCKGKTPSDIDDIISAELPSPTDDPDGYKAATDYILHGS